MAIVKPRWPQLRRGDTLARSLVGAWPFYEGAGSLLHDISGSRSDGTLVNTPSWTLSQIGEALSFDGSTQYVSTADYHWSEGQPFSISVRFFPTALQQAVIVGKGDNTFSGDEFSLQQEASGSLGFSYWDTSGNQALFLYGPGVTADAWHHVAITFDGANGSMFIDNEAPITASSTGAPFQHRAAPLLIGAGHFSEVAANQYFAGLVGDLRIWNRALTTGEIARLKGADPFALYRGVTPVTRYFIGDSGALTTSLAEAALASAGQVTASGSLSDTLGAIGTASAGTVLAKGAASDGLAAASALAIGTVPDHAAIARTLSPAVAEATAEMIVAGTATPAALAAATASGAGTVTVAGAGEISLAGVASLAAGTALVRAALAGSLAEAALVSLGVVGNSISAAAMVGLVPASLAALGEAPVVGAAVPALSGATAVAAAHGIASGIVIGGLGTIIITTVGASSRGRASAFDAPLFGTGAADEALYLATDRDGPMFGAVAADAALYAASAADQALFSATASDA